MSKRPEHIGDGRYEIQYQHSIYGWVKTEGFIRREDAMKRWLQMLKHEKPSRRKFYRLVGIGVTVLCSGASR